MIQESSIAICLKSFSAMKNVSNFFYSFVFFFLISCSNKKSASPPMGFENSTRFYLDIADNGMKSDERGRETVRLTESVVVKDSIFYGKRMFVNALAYAREMSAEDDVW